MDSIPTNTNIPEIPNSDTQSPPTLTPLSAHNPNPKQNPIKFIVITLVLFCLIITSLTAFLLINRQPKPPKYSLPQPTASSQTLPQFGGFSNLSPGNGSVYYLSNNRLNYISESDDQVHSLPLEFTLKTLPPTGFNLDYHQATQTLYLIYKGDIWQASLQGELHKQITKTQAKVFDFKFSPDQKTIFFDYLSDFVACCGSPEPNHEVLDAYLVNANGTNQRKIQFPPLTLDGKAVGYTHARFESWFPDNQHLLIRGAGILDTTNNFWEVDIATNQTTKFSRYGQTKSIDNMPEISLPPSGNEYPAAS